MKTAETKSTHSRSHAADPSVEPGQERAFFSDFSETIADRTPFFSSAATPNLQAKSASGGAFFRSASNPIVQAKCSACDAEKQKQSEDSLQIQRMPAFESDEPIVQRQAIAKSTGITPTAVTLQLQGEADELKLLEEQPEEFPQVQRLPALASADNPDDEAEPVLQFSLTIGQPGDAYEREADAMADRVVAISKSRSRTPSALQAKPLAPSIARLKRRSNRQIQAKCAVCQTTEDLVPRLQRKPSLLTQRNSSLSPRPEVSARLQRAKGSGSRLDDPTRSRMEAAFGSDFSRVRIHTGSEAIQLSQDLGAQAFTHGSDIYFNAGQYNPTARDGEHLLAHELTHTVQQGASPTPADDRPPPPNLSTATPPDLQPGFLDDVEELWDDATDAVEEAGDAIGDAAESAYEAVAEVGEEAYEIAAEIGEEAYETAVEVGETLYEAGGVVVDVASDIASEVVDFWLSTPAGQLAQRIASALDGLISISSAGIEINIPRVCPIDALLFRFNLPSIGGKYMVPIFRLPIGPDVFISGDIGVAGSITPEAQIQLGPICLNGLHLLLNPFTDTYSISGSLSATLGAALGAEVRGGVRGELGLEAIVPIGGVPVPISVPLIGLEGGLAGMVRGIGGTTLTIGGGFSLGGGVVSLDQYRQLDFGLGADLFLGAYGQLDIAGTNVCRIYWQPLEWHGDIAASLGISAGLTIIPGATPLILPRVDPPTLQEIPFDQIPLIVSRGGFSDQCPIIDQLCDVLRELNLLPSQNGGKWNWAGPHGPGKRLLGPLEVYEKTPPIASKSECRGACGPNCDTCEPYPVYYFTDPVTGVIWEYTNFQDCNSNDGCREHDAAFDWAAAEKGETGRWDIVMPWHMAANLECACNNLAGNCIAWIVGLPPYDRKMFFADTATPIASGNIQEICQEEHPGVIGCTEENADRDTVLQTWGLQHRIENFRDHHLFRSFPPGEIAACGSAAGNIWHSTATDLDTGESFTVSIYECECCNADGILGSLWTQPQVVVEGTMSEELILSLCDKGLILRVICIPIEEDMIRRFGNRRRDLNLDPDVDPGRDIEQRLRLDDAPIVHSFRRVYNRLSSWNIFIRTNHPDWYGEFQETFKLTVPPPEKGQLEQWATQLKELTARYKQTFRNLEAHDVDEIRRRYTSEVQKIQDEMEAKNRDIAIWYQGKTGSDESIEDLTERVHREGTELWRAAWRRAILQVNRVLARLWPPAKTRILIWVGQMRVRHPHIDLSGSVGELDYIGSLATGFKGPPKQLIRFNPDKFDVDANLEALPLAKYALAIDGQKPDRQRIFGRNTSITPLNDFSDAAQTELAARVAGYDNNPADPFDVVIEAEELPTQNRQRLATERLYTLRTRLSESAYSSMLTELHNEALVEQTANGLQIPEELTVAQYQRAMEIMDRYST